MVRSTGCPIKTLLKEKLITSIRSVFLGHLVVLLIYMDRDNFRMYQKIRGHQFKIWHRNIKLVSAYN